VMSKNIHFCAPDDTVASAEQIMRAHQIRRLPHTGTSQTASTRRRRRHSRLGLPFEETPAFEQSRPIAP
jgi:hypothetical protein